MLIDCDACSGRPQACGDCVITTLLGGPPGAVHHPPPGPRADPAGGWEVDLDDVERSAVAALAAAGLVPPLRMVPMLARSSDVPSHRHDVGRVRAASAVPALRGPARSA